MEDGAPTFVWVFVGTAIVISVVSGLVFMLVALLA